MQFRNIPFIMYPFTGDLADEDRYTKAIQKRGAADFECLFVKM